MVFYKIRKTCFLQEPYQLGQNRGLHAQAPPSSYVRFIVTIGLSAAGKVVFEVTISLTHIYTYKKDGFFNLVNKRAT